MRPTLVLVAFLCTLGLSAAGVIQVAPAGPRVNQPVTFTLTGVTPLAGTQSWSFGDDSSATGSSTATHTYDTARTYHVRVNFTLAASGPASAETSVTVAPPFSSGPNAPFNLASVLLRWKDGQSSVSVPKNSSALVAYADLKFEGTGQLQAQWLLDGQVVKTVTQAMSFAAKATLDSGTTPVFPTSTLGAHEVTLKILNPPVNFRLPVLRYVVSLAAPQPPPPVVESLTPPAVYAGQEAEIQITGQNLTQEMKLDFGSGITFLGPITVMSPMSAKVKVFVPPTVKLGFHTLAMIKGQDRLLSKARLEIRAPQKVMSGSGSMPCPDQATFKQETVDLKAPDWQNELPDHAGFQDNVPTLTDFTVFEWSEKVQGAAEAFELRLYDKTGKNLILAQRLPGGAKQWNVTADFVPKLVNLVKGGSTPYAAKRGTILPPGTKVTAAKQMLAPTTTPMASPMTKLFSGQATTQFASGYNTAASAALEKAQQEAQQKAKDAAERATHLAKIADVLWQIVGLRDYTCLPKSEADAGGRPGTKVAPASGKGLPGPGKGGTLVQPLERSASPAPVVTEAPKPVKMTLEVEASEFWPLKLPDQAVGVSYGSCSLKAPGTTLGALPLKGGGDANTYPGDVFELKGNFTLKGSPYGSKPTNVTFAQSGPGVISTTPIACSFDNVFVDWGDGKPLQSLSPTIKNEASGSPTSISSNALFELPAGQYNHAYEKPGTYNLRVFMLSEDDVQLAGFSSGAAKALAAKGSLDTNFLKLLKVATATPGGLQAPPAKSATPDTGFAKIGGMQVANSAIASSLLQTIQPSIQQILSRAYVILCDTKHIREFADPCATKPLELVDLELSFDTPKSAKGAKGGVFVGTQNLAVSAKTGKAVPSSKPLGTKTVKVASPGKLSLANQGAGQVSAQGPGFSAAGNYSLKVDAVTSTCNEAFGVHTRVRYFGHGVVKVTWIVDNEVVAVSEPTDLSMKPRTGLTKAQSEDKDCATVAPAEEEINLPEFLPVKTAGVHVLRAHAVVVPETKKVDLNQAVLELSALGQDGKASVSPSTLALLGAASSGSGKRAALKLGVLNPNPAPGMAQVVYVHDALPVLAKTPGLGVVGGLGSLKPGFTPGVFTKPPYFVEAGQKTYRVETLDPKEPCSFDFPTKGGSFRVTDLAGHATMEVVGGVTRVTGTGKLKVALRVSEDAADIRTALPIDLAQWEVDGFEVTKGEVNLNNLNQSVKLPGTKGTLDSLKGKVQGKGQTEDMLAKLTLIPSDASLTLTSNEKNTPVWVAEKPLSSEGDFYAESLSLPETYLGRTPWTMKSASGVVLDYSHKQGEGPAGQGKEWVGVRLKQLALRPFSFELVADSSSFPLVDSWYLGDGGLHGSVSFKNWLAKFQEGSIKVGSMNFSALGGQNYTATYQGTEVQVPWFPSPLKGDITMSKTADGFIWTYGAVKAPAMPKVVNGGFSLEPANLYFANEKNIAWTVMGDAKLAFQADGKPFAAFTLDRFCYHFDGRASFEQNALSKTVILNQKSSLGNTQADLKSVIVTTPTAGPSVVDFAFNTSLRLSDSPLLPAADTQVIYHLNKNGAAYSALQAATAPFELAMAFPMGSPSVNGKIHPVYAPGSGGGASTRYTGDVDLGMFGGPPFRTQFVLGYQGNKDFFLCRADIPLGPSGVVLYPELLTLYKIHGGLGYNFGVDAFKDNVSILNAQPDMKGNALFSAGMRVGSADSFAYMLDGTLTISTAGAARMDYDAWLLTTDHGGQGQFKGWFQYANSSFDGKLWGGLNMLGGLVQFSLGNSEANAAVDLHLASDSWHIYAGQKNGQRIKAKVITSESDSYLMLGSKEGFAIGGAQNYYLGIGDSSVASAYAKAYLDMGLQITPQPKIIGDFGAGMSAGVCVFGVCVSGGVNAAVHAEALPVNLRAACNLDLPWPLDDVSFTVHM